MRSVQVSGASGAPSPEILRRARIEASGVSSSLAASLVAIAFAAPKRDDVSTLMVMTASRCAVSPTGSRTNG